MLTRGFPGLPAPAEYTVGCWWCPEHFDAARASWCTCATAEPTLVCPWCRRCFCASPAEYRVRFWMLAPRGLWVRRHTSC